MWTPAVLERPLSIRRNGKTPDYFRLTFAHFRDSTEIAGQNGIAANDRVPGFPQLLFAKYAVVILPGLSNADIRIDEIR